MPISGFLEPMFLLSKKACLLNKRSKIVFSRFILTIYYIEIQGVTRGYRGLYRVKGGYKRLQEVRRGYRVLQRIIETFLIIRTFPDTFSWLILHKNQS